MSNEKTTAYWLRQFADAEERDPASWHLEYEVIDSPRDTKWDVPISPYALVSKALREPDQVRHAVRRITIIGPGGEYSYPEPMRTAPVCDTQYWTPTRGLDALAVHHVWTGSGADYNRLRRGLCHAEQSAAREHAEAEVRAAGFEL